MKYVALLRGINVGGNTKIAMSELVTWVGELGHSNVRTYINSGNVIFESAKNDTAAMARELEQKITQYSSYEVRVVVYSGEEYRAMFADMPKNWAQKADWKYNVLFLIPPYDIGEIMIDIGELKPDIETVVPRDGVIFQSLQLKTFGRATSGKLASRPSYKKMTIRNWNTTKKLLELLK
jgi:uncharacterized protein (DUF1697 family)